MLKHFTLHQFEGIICFKKDRDDVGNRVYFSARKQLRLYQTWSPLNLVSTGDSFSWGKTDEECRRPLTST
jgi:hypothetical protein